MADMSDADWDWQITQVQRNSFSLVFRSKVVLRMSKMCGTMTLPISKHEAEVGDPLVEPKAISWLQETWICVYGVSDKLHKEPLVKEFLRVVGKTTVVDELSLIRFEEPVRAKIWCRKPDKIHGFFEIFSGVDGFQMRVEQEVGGLRTPC